jgi:hypothetical protein
MQVNAIWLAAAMVASGAVMAEPDPVGSARAAGWPAAGVAPLFEQPGVLTPRGKFVLEPSLQFGYSSSNRVVLVGTRSFRRC